MEEENVRQLRSSRSRSNTPLVRASRDRDKESVHGSEDGKRISTTHTRGRQRGGGRQRSSLTTVTESHTSEVSVTTHKHVNRRSGGVGGGTETDSSTERTTGEEQKVGKRSDHQKTRRRHVANGAMPQKEDEVLSSAAKKLEEENIKQREQKTSDYSSEEGEGVAYQIYKRAGDWWNKFPKTDYTYSPISPHRKEVAPGVIVMPNMSRRSLNSMRQHGISSSESNLASSGLTTITRHQKSKSRWVDSSTSTSGSHTSRKVLEDWAAVDSDVDDVAETFARKTSSHAQKSSTITTYITSFFLTIWTYITTTYNHTVDAAYRLVGYQRDGNIYATPRRGVSPVGEGSASWLRRIFNWCYKMVCSLMRLDLLFLSSWHNTQIDQEQETYYEEDEYTETDAISKVSSPQNHKFWRLLLLLLPLLFLAAGWWYVSDASDVSFNPLLVAVDTAKNTVVDWLFIPFVAFGALKERLTFSMASPDLPLVVMPSDEKDPEQQKTVDIESLVQYILASKQFQEQLASQVHAKEQTANQERGRINTAINQQKQLHQENEKLLEEHQALLAQVTENLEQLQKKMDNIDAETKKIQAHEEEWKHEWETEKQNLIDEAIVARPVVSDSDQSFLRKELRDLQSRFRLLQEQQVQIKRRCCQRRMAHAVVQGDVIEQHVIKVLADLLGATGGQYSGDPADLRAWVRNMMLAKEDLEARIANLTVTMDQDTREAVQRSKEVIMSSVKDHIQNEFAKWQEQLQQRRVEATVSTNMGSWSTNSNSTSGLSDLQVRAIVDEALAKYDADKTGLVDYALESSGGSIVSTRCTESYQTKTAELTLLGIPLWYPSNNPRTVIQPGVHPGECWAFSGSQGFLVIKLSGSVQITGFSVEHIPRILSPHGKIDSAPKDFTVWGLRQEQDGEPVKLGKYTYQQNGTSLQNFSVQRADVGPFEFIELQIESNHGNVEYTCLYRFRVHGMLASNK